MRTIPKSEGLCSSKPLWMLDMNSIALRFQTYRRLYIEQLTFLILNVPECNNARSRLMDLYFCRGTALGAHAHKRVYSFRNLWAARDLSPYCKCGLFTKHSFLVYRI